MANKDMSKRIFTIPNIISMLRLLMIPQLIWLYFNDYFIRVAILLVISGVSDVLDGIIARKFNMSSNLGRVLDPAADKLTQLAVLFCLVDHFPQMLVPAILLAVKELATGILSLIALKKTGKYRNSEWHGKVTTAFLYASMFTHILWTDMPPVVSYILTGVSVVLMIISFVLYVIIDIKMIKGDTASVKSVVEDTGE